jgi:hypothetical protein
LRNEDDTGFSKLSAPARRAVSGAGYTRLDQLAQVSEADLSKLHGMGPTAIKALRAALDERGRSFNMADVTHAGIDELDAIQGFLEGFTFRRATRLIRSRSRRPHREETRCCQEGDRA